MYKNKFYLIKTLAMTDFKIRYNSSILGYMWSLLNPLLTFTVLYIVFSIFMRFAAVENYQLYLLLGIIIWSYFQDATQNSMESLLNKSALISKINFPKIIIIIAANLSTLLTLLLNMLVFSVFFIFSNASISIAMPLIILYLGIFIVFTFAVSLLISAFYLRFRDLSHLWTVALQIGFWLTPIIYPLTVVPNKFRQLFMLNPIAGMIDSCRQVLIYGTLPSFLLTFILIVITIALLFAGIIIFNRRSRRFAEEL